MNQNVIWKNKTQSAIICVTSSFTYTLYKQTKKYKCLHLFVERGNKRSIIIPGVTQTELNLSFSRGLDEKHRQTTMKINKTDYIR